MVLINFSRLRGASLSGSGAIRRACLVLHVAAMAVRGRREGWQAHRQGLSHPEWLLASLPSLPSWLSFMRGVGEMREGERRKITTLLGFWGSYFAFCVVFCVCTCVCYVCVCV